MTIQTIDETYSSGRSDYTTTIRGWVKTFRSNRFIALNDGSTLRNFQAVLDFEKHEDALVKRITTGAALELTGQIVPSQGKGQELEMLVATIVIHGDCPAEEFPIQPKKHSLEFLREKAHLRFRTTTFQAVFRLRHGISYAIHKYFNDRGFYYMHTPIITGSDAEGAGEMFRVTTLPEQNPPLTPKGDTNFDEDFFAKETHLTVSGQLEAELAALAMGKVYTFGPTFRAENSNTSRHLAEFWMIEPEVAFNDLTANMDLAEDMLKYIISYCMEQYPDDLAFLEQRLLDEEKQLKEQDRQPLPLREKLKFVTDHSFERVRYTEAIDILRNSNHNKKKKFKYIIEQWGADLQSEHERYLVEKHFGKPVILYDYPAAIKAFYMRQNDDGNTVAAMDILFPGIGEIVGGSQREERYEVLRQKMRDFNIPENEMWWYLETRKFGTVPHAGYGLGLERLISFITGMSNVRDVIPFPRTPRNAEF
ncbi:MAG: asparagine--tRNA ligase, partial [Flavobacteriales bacterium]|nr:asparagine--tRNA ligase [Flavobacteriales bacterium]